MNLINGRTMNTIYRYDVIALFWCLFGDKHQNLIVPRHPIMVWGSNMTCIRGREILMGWVSLCFTLAHVKGLWLPSERQLAG